MYLEQTFTFSISDSIFPFLNSPSLKQSSWSFMVIIFFQEHFTFHLFLQDSYVNTNWKRWQILMVLVCSISNYLEPPPIYFFIQLQ